MGFYNEASILIQDYEGWTTDELMNVWALSDDPVERYAASRVVRHRAADMIELQAGLREYGEENPDKAVRLQ